jgi:alcohol dehydrogenase class IV
MRFEFATATRIIFGPGTVSEAPRIAREFGRRALLVTGRDSSRAEPIAGCLADQGVEVVTFSVFYEPEVSTIEQAVTLAKSRKCDVVLSIGGGSAIDAGKAVAAMLTNPGTLLDYLEVIGAGKSLANPSVPFIAIPTTSGTGSEVTRNAVLASAEYRVKVSLRGPSLLPRVALVDPELTHSMPAFITAATGMDALTQVIEPYVCSRANPMVDALCLDGVARAARSLRSAVNAPSTASCREDMALTSLFGGLALANAGLGAVHGFAGPIGGMFTAPHGAICGALLPHVMEINIRALRSRARGSPALERYEKLARILTGDPAAKAEAGAEFTRELVRDLSIPPLGKYGAKPEHTVELVEKAGKASSMKSNPIALTQQELAEILERAL